MQILLDAYTEVIDLKTVIYKWGIKKLLLSQNLKFLKVIS